MNILRGKHTTARITARDTDDGCLAQIQGLCDHPAFTNPIVIMPDAHAGKGAVIGFTMARRVGGARGGGRGHRMRGPGRTARRALGRPRRV